MEVEGIGFFKQGDGYWEAEPERMNGASLSIESSTVTDEHVKRSVEVCYKWESYVERSIGFIEASRGKYGLVAQQFFNPSALVNDDNEWTIYFSTENEFESTVGVEFRSDNPFQLIIGG